MLGYDIDVIVYQQCVKTNCYFTALLFFATIYVYMTSYPNIQRFSQN